MARFRVEINSHFEWYGTLEEFAREAGEPASLFEVIEDVEDYLMENGIPDHWVIDTPVVISEDSD